jgi:hypothetical protein
MNVSRRVLIQAGLAGPIAFAAAPALAETLEDQCKRELAPTLDFPQLGKYRADNERLIASKAPVKIVFLGDSITEGWNAKRPGFSRRAASAGGSAVRRHRRWCSG